MCVAWYPYRPRWDRTETIEITIFVCPLKGLQSHNGIDLGTTAGERGHTPQTHTCHALDVIRHCGEQHRATVHGVLDVDAVIVAERGVHLPREFYTSVHLKSCVVLWVAAAATSIHS